MSAMPASIRAGFVDLTKATCDGRYYLVSNLIDFALARWDGDLFVLSGGKSIDFTPTHFYRAQSAEQRGDFNVKPALQNGRVVDFEVRRG